MDDKENNLALSLVNHINNTFLIINNMKRISEYDRKEKSDTNDMFIRENLYNTYLQCIYNDLFILSNISDRFVVFNETIINLYNREKNDVDEELSKIISKLNDEYKY